MSLPIATKSGDAAPFTISTTGAVVSVGLLRRRGPALAREKGARGPSLGPLVAPILAIVGSLAAPQRIVALVVPLALVLDLATISLGRILLKRTQRPR